MDKDIIRLEQKFKRLAEQSRQQRAKGESEKSEGEYSLPDVDKRKKSVYNEFRTQAMIWANSASTNVGDTKLFNRNGRNFVLLESTEDGYIEIASGNYKELRAEYERLYSQENRGIYWHFEEFRSEQGGNFLNLQSNEDGTNDVGNSRPLGSQRLQDDSARNNEHLQSSDKGISSSEADSINEPAYSLPDLDADYLKAVENGDMETAQRMVDEAARESGHRIKGHHGTDIRFTIFDREKSNSSNDFGKGFYFSSSEFEAEQYQKDDAFGDTYNKIDGIAYDNALEKIRDMGEDANDDALFTRIYNEEFDKELKRRTDEGTVINAYLKMENPFIVSTGNWITEEEAINIAKNTMYADDVPDDIAISDWVHSIKAYAKQHDGKVDTNHFANNMGHAINLTNALLHQGKYDGVLDYTVGEKFGTTSDYHAIALYPNQIKSADPVTYDDKGNVIPLSERFNPDDKDIRYSLPEIDNEGNKLSEGQRRFFDKSKLTDEQGNLLRLYHGSRNGGFTKFSAKYSDDGITLFLTP